MNYSLIFVIFSVLARSLALDVCSEALKCTWPIKQNTDIKKCRCNAGFLNLSDTCCLSEWWIVGLSLGSGAILLLIILVLICVVVMASKTNKKTEQLLVLSQERLHEKNKEETDESPEVVYKQGLQNIGSDSVEAEENNPSRTDVGQYQGSPYQPDEEFQRHSQNIMNKRRSNFLGYQPTAKVSEEVANMAQNRNSISPPSLYPTPMHPSYHLNPSFKKTNNVYTQQPKYPTSYPNNNFQPAEFSIKRPTLNGP